MQSKLFPIIMLLTICTMVSTAALIGALTYVTIFPTPHCPGVMSENGAVCLPKPELPKVIELGRVQLIPLLGSVGCGETAKK